MYSVQYGGQTGEQINLEVSPNLVVVRTEKRGSVLATPEASETPLSSKARQILGEFDRRYPKATAAVKGRAAAARTQAKCAA